MAIFKDPIGTLTFELSAEWAYDLLYSTLTDFFFAHWDRPDEILVVHLRRASVEVDISEEEWISKIQEEVGEKKDLFDIDSPNGRVVATDFVSNEGMTQRVAFLRGTYVDIAIEQRNADMSSQEPWEALSRAIQTIVSNAKPLQSGEYGPEEFNKTIDAANEAFEKKDSTGVIKALNDAMHIGTSAWLSSLTNPSGSPEVHAAVRVAQAMVHLGRFTGDAFLSRDAASILRRSLCSLEAAGKATMEQAKGLVAELKEVLASIESELLEKADSDVSHDSAPVVSIRERGFRLAQAGAMAFDADDFNSASAYAQAAVEDFLFLLAYFRRGRSQQIPDEILKHLVDQGISDHEEQREAIQIAREGILFPALNVSLQIRYYCAMENKDSAAALETAELYLPLARQVHKTSPGDTSIELNLVLALLDTVGAITAMQDREKLQDAQKHLDEAVQVLDATGDKQCQDDGWVRNHKQQIEKSVKALNGWLSVAKEDGNTALATALQSLYSKLENTVGRLQDKIVNKTSEATGNV